MRKICYILTVTFLSALAPAQSTAQAPVADKYEMTTLKTVSVDQGLSQYKDVKVANIEIDDTANVLTLTLIFPSPCGPPKPGVPSCTRPQKAPVTFTLPVDTTPVAQICGIRVISAQQDQRPVDGVKTLVEVTDYSHFTCETLKPFNPDELTHVVLEIQGYNQSKGTESPFDYRMDFRGPALTTAIP